MLQLEKIKSDQSEMTWFTHPSVVQLHGEVPVEAAPAGIVARPEVLSDPGVPCFTHTERCGGGALPLLEDPSQFVSLPELHTRSQTCVPDTQLMLIIVLIVLCSMILFAFTLRRLVSRQGCMCVSVSSESAMQRDS